MIKNNLLNHLFPLLFVGIWLSIGSNPKDFFFFFEENYNNEISFIQFLNFLRAGFPIICFIVGFFIIIKYRIFKINNDLIVILLIINLLQIITTYYSKDTILSNYESNFEYLGRFHWIISSIAALQIFLIYEKIEGSKPKTLLLISILFLAVIILWFSYKNIYDFLTLEIKTSLYDMSIYRENAFFLNHEMPRVTGLSRSILVIYIILLFFKFTKNKFLNFLRYFLIIILGVLIFLYQSKFSIIFLLIINIFYLFCSRNKFKTGIILILILIFQISIFYLISSSRIYFNNDQNISEINIINKDGIGNKADYSNKNKTNRHIRGIYNHGRSDSEQFLYILFSGRIDLWSKSFEFIRDRPFLAYGSMSDRILFNVDRIESNIPTLNPISNSYLYCIISGGLICFVLLFYFWFKIFKFKIIFFNFKNKQLQKNIISLVMLMIFLRGFIENSIMLFGIDYILTLHALTFEKKI